MKYFLALFCIMFSPFLFSMKVKYQPLDKVTKKILLHYLKLKKKNKLNEQGVNIVSKAEPRDFTLLIEIENDSEHKIALLLRENIENEGSQSKYISYKAGSFDIVHKSNANYANTRPEVRPFDLTVKCKFTKEEFAYFCKKIK